MGIGWAIIALIAPGLPQFLHVDIFKALIIWFLPGVVAFTGGTLLGPIMQMGPISVAIGVSIFLYNIHTAMQY